MIHHPMILPILKDTTLLGASEAGEQMAVFQWKATYAERYPALRTMFHPANGEKRNVVTAVRLKAMGVVSGVPDILLPRRGLEFVGLAVEMKVGKNTCSQSQIDFMYQLWLSGWSCVVAYSARVAVGAIVDYLKLSDDVRLI